MTKIALFQSNIGIDPAASGEFLEQRAIETTRGAVVDVLDGGLMAQPGMPCSINMCARR